MKIRAELDNQQQFIRMFLVVSDTEEYYSASIRLADRMWILEHEYLPSYQAFRTLCTHGFSEVVARELSGYYTDIENGVE